ncbi:MAG: hypothetical protein N2450_02540 [bacterium]|nr:hypothetical protein [bacterium]
MKYIIILLLLLLIVSTIFASIPDNVWIHYSGNLRGMLDPCGCKIPAGGIAQRIGEIEQYQALTHHEAHFWVDAGEWMDLFDPINGDKKTICLLNAIHYGPIVAVNVSIRDFLRETTLLDTLTKMKSIPLISANLRDTYQKPLFPPYRLIDTIIQKKRVKIGIIGLTDPINNKSITKKNGLIALDWTLILKDIRKELKQLGCEDLILLTDAQIPRLDSLLQNERPFSLIVSSSPSWRAGEIHLKNYGPVVAPEVQGKNWEAVKSNSTNKSGWELFTRPLVQPVKKNQMVEKLVEDCKKTIMDPFNPLNVLTK